MPNYSWVGGKPKRNRHVCLTSIFFSLEYWFQSRTSSTVRPQPVQTSPPTLCEQIPLQGLESGLLGRITLIAGRSRGECQTYYQNCHFLPAKTQARQRLTGWSGERVIGAGQGHGGHYSSPLSLKSCCQRLMRIPFESKSNMVDCDFSSSMASGFELYCLKL